MPPDSDGLPNVGEVVGPLILAEPENAQPLFVALAERIAASRYRAWAEEVKDESARAEILACAEREEEIARRVEALFPDAAAVQARLQEKHPDLLGIYRGVLESRTLRDQFTIQSRGERLGAATWRRIAEQASEPAAREIYESCALLEEESALVLERVLATLE
jgi:hypothetical protein